MDISIQSKINYQTTRVKREQMIKEEKLHIKDEITYERFEKLHNKYAKEMTENDFAKYFLDIDYMSYYKLQDRIIEHTIILEREFYLDEEFDEIEKLTKCEYSKTTINYDTLNFLWKKYGNRFSLKMFAEEVFGLSDNRISDLKYVINSQANISREKRKAGRRVIRILREKIIEECKFHMNSEITLEEFNKIYNQYKIDGLDRIQFALKIFGIQQDTFKRFEKGKRIKKVIFFASYPINPDYIMELRERVILLEKLTIDSITTEKFDRLYETYGGILTKEVFAEEILDTSYNNVKNAKKRGNGISILGNIEISDEYIEDLRDKIIKEYNLKYNQMMTIKEMRVIYYSIESQNLACYLMGEKQFIVKVLGVPSDSYTQLDEGTTYESHILVNIVEIDLQNIRQLVIKENNLHYDDTIGYKKFHKLHKKYAPTVREHIFAREVLDIQQKGLDRIRANKVKNKTHILLDEPLPTVEAIKQIKENVIIKFKMHRKDTITYKQFQKIYKKYGGVMPEDMFSEQILDIKITSLVKLRRGYIPETEVLRRTFMSVDEIEELRNKVLVENKLVPSSEFSVKTFNELYTRYNHTLPVMFFAKHIIGLTNVNRTILNDIENETILRISIKRGSIPQNLSQDDIDIIREYLIQDISISEIAVALQLPVEWLSKKIDLLYNENIISLEDIKRQRILRLYYSGNSFKKIANKLSLSLLEVKAVFNEITEEDKEAYVPMEIQENKVIRIVQECSYNSKNVAIVKQYIKKEQKRFIDMEDISESKLEFLKECLEFVQGGLPEIKFLVMAYSSLGKYDEAKAIINDNIYNEGISKEDTELLLKMRDKISYKIKLERASEILSTGDRNFISISNSLGVSESEVIKLARKMKSEENEIE